MLKFKQHCDTVFFQLPVHVSPGSAPSSRIPCHSGCQVVNAGNLSAHHSFGTEARCSGPWHSPTTLYLLNSSQRMCAAGSIGTVLRPHLWRHRSEEMASHIYLWHMKNRSWLWNFLYLKPFSNTFSSKWEREAYYRTENPMALYF